MKEKATSLFLLRAVRLFVDEKSWTEPVWQDPRIDGPIFGSKQDKRDQTVISWGFRFAIVR